jgi:cardiolipin synthase A/B
VAGRWLLAWGFLTLWLLTSGCISSGKRLAYLYNPSYGVESPEFMRSLEVLRTQIVPGNRAVLLENGDGFFPDILRSIHEAKQSVNIEMYLFAEGSIGAAFATALCERARAGVEVRVIVDDVGARLDTLDDQMIAAGVHFQIYKPLRIYSLLNAGHRTHRKIITVDGRIGYCGGLGIDDRWQGNARNPQEWRDLVVRVEGPVVSQLQSIFMEDWLHTTGEVLHGFGQFPALEPAGKILAQAVASARTDQSSMAKLMIFMAIQAARKRIWIENAYFVPDRQIRRGLIAAAKRGVDVRVLVPGKYADIPLVRRASRYRYGELLDGGVKIYEYRPTMLHAKAMVVDGLWTTIGSINFVTRSMVHNAEANIAIYDQDFAGQVERVIESDRAKSELFTKEAWKKRGLGARLGEAVGWMFSEIY